MEVEVVKHTQVNRMLCLHARSKAASGNSSQSFEFFIRSVGILVGHTNATDLAERLVEHMVTKAVATDVVRF